MLNLALAVVCSVLVSVLLKLAPRQQLELGQMVTANYVVAGGLAAWILAPALPGMRQPWPELLALGVLLPTVFIVLGLSVRSAGIVRSDVAQRLSLLVSLSAAFLWFGQPASPRLLVGIAVGAVALLALLWRGRAGVGGGLDAWVYPVLVLCGFGAIDALEQHVAASGAAFGTGLSLMFALAFLVSCAMLSWRLWQRRTRLSLASLSAGLLLGALNFGNILFYLRAHRALADDPARVFTAMNLGVVALGAVVGMALFGERLSRVNGFGLALTVPAILLLAVR